MAKAEIYPGNCGLSTTVIATGDMMNVNLQIESECAHIRKLAANLPQVNPLEEMSQRGGIPKTLEAGHNFCTHTSCPVPVGILKVVEIAAGMALPDDVTIRLTNDDE